MKSIKIAAFAVLAAVLLVGCGEQSVSETSGSSVESTTSSSSSVESSSEPSSTSGGQSSSSSEVADNQEILKSSQSSQGDSSTSDTSIDVSTSEPTPDTSTPTSPYWNPDAPGNKPGPYGGYYDANGALHAKADSVPLDSTGAPVVSFWTEYGSYRMTRADKEARDAEIKHINEGGSVNYDNDPDDIAEIWELLNS